MNRKIEQVTPLDEQGTTGGGRTDRVIDSVRGTRGYPT